MVGHDLIPLQVLSSSKEGAEGMAGSSSGKGAAGARLAVLKSRLFRAVCRRVSQGLLNRARLLFAVRLAQVSASRNLGTDVHVMCMFSSRDFDVLPHFAPCIGFSCPHIRTLEK